MLIKHSLMRSIALALIVALVINPTFASASILPVRSYKIVMDRSLFCGQALAEEAAASDAHALLHHGVSPLLRRTMVKWLSTLVVAPITAFAQGITDQETVQWVNRLTNADLQQQTQPIKEFLNLNEFKRQQVLSGLVRFGLSSSDHRRRVRSRKLLIQLANSKANAEYVQYYVQRGIDSGLGEKDDLLALIVDGSLRILLRLTPAWGRTQMRYVNPRYNPDEVDFINHVVAYAYNRDNFPGTKEEKEEVVKPAREALEAEARRFIQDHPQETLTQDPHRHFLIMMKQLAVLVLDAPARKLTQNDLQKMMNDIIDQVDADYPALPEMRAWPLPLAVLAAAALGIGWLLFGHSTHVIAASIPLLSTVILPYDMGALRNLINKLREVEISFSHISIVAEVSESTVQKALKRPIHPDMAQRISNAGPQLIKKWTPRIAKRRISLDQERGILERLNRLTHRKIVLREVLRNHMSETSLDALLVIMRRLRHPNKNDAGILHKELWVLEIMLDRLEVTLLPAETFSTSANLQSAA
jgi:hypothetical protein